MIFASSGAKLMEQKLALARRRAFLFTDDTTPPTSQSTAVTVMNTMNKARSFSQYADTQSFKCTRMAGYRSMKYYHTLIDSPTYGVVLPTSTESASVSPQDLFRRYYSVGALFADGPVVGMNVSVLDNTSLDLKNMPPNSAIMLLPTFDSTITEANINPKCSIKALESVALSASSSGNITTVGQWSSSDSTSYTAVSVGAYTYTEATNVTVSSSITGLGSLAANAASNVTSAGAMTLRVLYAWRTNVYGTRYFSGGGWTYSTSYSKGPLATTTNFVETDRMYSTPLLTRADTPATKITWAMLPVSYHPNYPAMVQILREGTDFTHATPTLPGDIPQITIAPITNLVLSKTIML